MSIIRTLPKSAKLREAAAVFTFRYNEVSEPGKYVCINSPYTILNMICSNVYLLESLSISGSIPAEVFAQSVQPAALPKIRILRTCGSGNQVVSNNDLTISQYVSDRNISQHVVCNQSDDGLALSITGQLNQVEDTVGVMDICMSVSITTYEISEREFLDHFKG